MNSPETLKENDSNFIRIRSSFILSQKAIRTTYNSIFTERFFFYLLFFGKRFSTTSPTLTYLTLLLCYNCFAEHSFYLMILLSLKVSAVCVKCYARAPCQFIYRNSYLNVCRVKRLI